MIDITPTVEKKDRFLNCLKDVLIKDYNINPEQANYMIQNTYLQDFWNDIIRDKDIQFCIYMFHDSMDKYAKELIEEFDGEMCQECFEKK